MAEITHQQPEMEETPTKLLEKIAARVRGLAKYWGCASEADDIAQETLLILHKRYSGNIATDELIKIANKVCMNLVRNYKRGIRPTVPLPDSIRDATSGPEESFGKSESVEALLRTIEKAGARCQKLFALELQGADTNQICSSLRLRPDMVHVLKHRCHKRLRKALEFRK